MMARQVSLDLHVGPGLLATLLELSLAAILLLPQRRELGGLLGLQHFSGHRVYLVRI